MHAVIHDQPPSATRRTEMLGAMVEHIGDERFLGSLMTFCSEAAGASDCSLLLHRGPQPQLAGAISVAGSRARDVGDWYIRGGFYRVEPSLQLARESKARLLVHTVRKNELPDARWSERYERVGLAERVSLLVALDDGWVFMNAYRPPHCNVAMDDAARTLGEQGPVIAAAVRRHLAIASPANAAPAAACPLAALSDRERQVVDAILAGFSAKECARQLGLSPTSIATYRQRAFEKLGIRRQVQLFQLMQGAPA
jgi:DNA-binding CsgD family transcriptional regulator